MVSIVPVYILTLGELLLYVITIIVGLIISKCVYDFVQKLTVSQRNVTQNPVGVANRRIVTINIGRDLISSAKEPFEVLDPPRASKVFKGRENELKTLEVLFFKEGKRKVVIHGLPGFGKTELAVQFAKHCKYSTNIDKAFWINAETSDNLISLHKTLKKVYKLFEKKRCLFIFDNGVSRLSIRQYEPPDVENFYLLITSHVAYWDDDIYQMPLKPLNMDAALGVFKAILSVRYEKGEENVYKEMLTYVSNVPLGLIVIAGHLRYKIDACKQKKFNTNQFLGEISKMLKTNTYHQSTYYENSIYAAMFVVLQKMYNKEFAYSEQIREGMMTVLGICAYLNPDLINITDIKEIMECSEENTVDECVYLSKNFSFIEYYDDGNIKIHRLCQRILKLYFDEIKKNYYSVCLRWLLRKENGDNHHEYTILMEADIKKKTVFEIYQQNISKKNYRYIEKLLRLLVQYGCSESCKLIFDNISFKKGKQFVDNMKLLHIAIVHNQADVSKLLLKYGDLNVRNSEGSSPLHASSWEGNIDIVRMLLEKGANVHVRDSEGKTPVHWASEKGNIDIVQMLLEKGADVHVRDNEGKTPLHWASWKGNIHIVRMLLETGADVHARDYEGKTPLHWASWNGNMHIVRMLLETGADVHARDYEGKTPLHWASWKGDIHIVRILLEKGADVHVLDNEGNTPLHMASKNRNVDIVRMLLETGADVHVPDNEGNTPLHMATKNRSAGLVRMLLEKRADVHARDSEGKTPLHWASRSGNIDIVRMLLKKKADVRILDNEDCTPLHWASRKGDIDIVRMLLEQGANVYSRESKGNTPLHWASQSGNIDIVRMLLEVGADVHARDSESKTPLHWASQNGNIDIVRMLLEVGADVHARDSEGKTPLHWASQSGNIDIVRMLLEVGADVHARDSGGKTPLHWASQNENIVIVRMLLDKGADVFSRERKGKTPLHWASQSGSIDIVRILLEEGADVHARDSEGKTPLHWASRSENIDIVSMLLEKGADVHARDNEGSTSLHSASRGTTDIVRILLEKGADVHARDNKGKTPLHWASRDCQENTDIVRMLLHKGADIQRRDNKGRTSLDCATYWGHTDIINILQQKMY